MPKLTLFALIPPFALLIASAPPRDQDFLRAANSAYLRGDFDAAHQHYSESEERSSDPGLVAFNRAAAAFQRGAYAEAESLYVRVLEDRECSRERAANAWFNRGVCLLRLGGSTRAYRVAIECFERCLDTNPNDAKFRNDAEHNLELAKMLWIKANAESPQPARPNELPPSEPPEPPPVKNPGKDEPGEGTDPQRPPAGKSGQQPMPHPTITPQPKIQPQTTDAKTAGNNAQLPVVRSGQDAAPADPASARELLKRTDTRLQQRRMQMNAILGGATRTGIRDW